MGLTEQQERAAHSPGSVAVTAGAGTGKTHMLSERYRYFLQQGFSPLQIVAVTFTEKAAAELRSRIRATIAADLGHSPDLLAELEAAQISTFHALAARICREHYDTAHVPPDFAVQDELESPLWQADVFADALAQLPSPFYLGIPYSLMREVLGSLLKDPLSAAQALEKGRDDWLPWVDRIRLQALETFLSDPIWLSSKQILQAYAAPGDKLEEHRLAALGAISSLEQGHDLAPALAALTGLKINVGSQKNWGGKEALAEVKRALSTLRDLAREAIKTGLIALEPNDFDDQTDALLPNLRGAFAWVRDFLQEAKYQQRVLDFNDLEIHALQALADPAVQHYYAQRWQVFLIDEFQDTNPTQGQLLAQLTANATLTIVGDVKQSIYGFRRADVRVFQDWQARIHTSDAPIELSTSFRTHQALINQINQVFAPVLADLHQPLDAHRQETLAPTPEIQLYTVTVDDGYKDDKSIDTTAEPCRRVEAQKIADLVKSMLDDKILVQDKPSNSLRPIRYGDIAVLSRTWGPLELYGTAIAARDIPILQAGGGNLLDTREAKDAWAMLRFLADPTDSLALAAVLRSPFFAVSDTILYALAQSLPEKITWWKYLGTSTDPALIRPRDILAELLLARRTEAPTRLLQLCDRSTGYTAVIANLPGADRRLADWQGFGELVRSLEAGSFDVLAVIRRLQRLQAAEVSIPRPALAGGDAVSLMTIHGAKGLEWPVVIVPDLARQSPPDSPLVRFDPALGVALKLEDEDGERQKSALYTLLEQRQKVDEREESKRVLYVALTRARDRLILTAAKPAGGGLDILQPGLEGLITPSPIPFAPELAQPVAPVDPAIPDLPDQIMLYPARAGFAELPVTALSDYAICPLRFKFRYVDGHPGYTSGDGIPNLAMEIGQLTHKALELAIDQAETLAPYAPYLPPTAIAEALSLAQAFRHSPVYAAHRAGATHWEHPVSLTLGDLTLNGVVDLVGDDFVLDFKTDQVMHPEHHQFQLWAYSRATGKPQAHIAYLRHDYLHSLSSSTLQTIDQEANALVERLMSGDFTPQATQHNCGICPYREVCNEAFERATP
ncbi:UvrD-helicase domain-containing protein [Leptolyngbya sp. PCC 6406]|uniref:UvrD-helicase domain-containing protein n=1 Tax=Leptolyngbya sp. PCC 6406 TaxID=1173264 RepID=UPI0002ABB13A|nr:UvrD-helicase domain-containing protein [Leptolyngbya sp. PCC 6406]